MSIRDADMEIEGKGTGYAAQDGVITLFNNVPMMMEFVPYKGDKVVGKVVDKNIFNIVSDAKRSTKTVLDIIRNYTQLPEKQRKALDENVQYILNLRDLWHVIQAYNTVVEVSQRNIPQSLCILARDVFNDYVEIFNFVISVSQSDRDAVEQFQRYRTLVETMLNFKCETPPSRVDPWAH